MAQIDRLKARLDGEDYTDDLLNELLTSAQDIMFSVMYPLRKKWPDALDSKWSTAQVDIAENIFRKSGAAGQTAHSENGISRSWGSEYITTAILSLLTTETNLVRT
jgi:hypothetical protein